MNGYPLRVRAELDAPNRWLPLVAWLLAIPQIILVAALNSGGSGWQWCQDGSNDTE